MTLSSYRRDRDRLVADTRLLMQDFGGERFTDASVISALHDTILDWNLRTRQVLVEAPFGLYEDHGEIDLRHRIQEDSGSLRAFAYHQRIVFVNSHDPADDGNPAGNPAMLGESIQTVDFRHILQGQQGTTPTRWMTDLTSPGKFWINPIPSEDGGDLDTPDYLGNFIATYIAMPTQMADGTEYPDSMIPAIYHAAYPHGAAARLLENGDEVDLRTADEFENVYMGWVLKATRDSHRGRTPYNSMRPM